jgi:hydrogenase-4 component F
MTTPTMLALYTPAAAPFLAGLLTLILPSRIATWTGLLAAAAVLASGITLTTTDATLSVSDGSGLLRADALTAWMLLTIGAVAVIACAAAPGYLRHDAAHHRRYLTLIQLFLACMSLAVLASNLGLLWVALEATTIVTAFLVGHRRTRESVEAAWKYVVLCSVGIAIAFLGIVCLYAASVAAGGHGITALDWTHLAAAAPSLDPALTKLATGLILLGFGTKAGLAPMHAWLPDAHSQAPAPVSALMSGVLLSVAFYAILRYRPIADAALGPVYVRTLLLTAGLASLVVAAMLLIAQRDYKRMLAYSSIEHMGLIALGTAFGVKLAIAAVLLHILGHGLVKSTAFCASGQVLHATGSPDIAAVRALATREPGLAGAFGISLVAMLGLPPFSLFASELGVARAGFASGQGWAVAVAFTLMLVAFVAIARHGARMLLGPPAPATAPPPLPPHPGRGRGLVWLGIGLAAAAVLGLYLGPLGDVLAAATVVAGGR